MKLLDEYHQVMEKSRALKSLVKNIEGNGGEELAMKLADAESQINRIRTGNG